MRVYINKKEYEALHDAREQISNTVEQGAEGDVLKMLRDTHSGLSSIISKYKP